MKQDILPIKKEFNYDERDSNEFLLNNCFVISFVHPAKGTSFIVKGDEVRVRKWIKENYKNSLTFEKRYIVGFRKEKTTYVNPILIIDGAICTCNHNMQLDKYRKVRIFGRLITVKIDGVLVFQKIVRRLPRCFPKELLKFIK